MTEKLNPIERALVAASGMGPPDARSVLMLICHAGMTTTEKVEQPPSPGAVHYAKREKIIKRTKAACDRVIDYAKHETLRKVEKHFRENAIQSGDFPGHEFHGNQYTGSKGLVTLSDHEKTIYDQIGTDWIEVHTLKGHGAPRTVNRLISKGLLEVKPRESLTELFTVRRKVLDATIQAAEGDEPKTLSEQLTFKKQRFNEEMAAVLREEATVALATAGQQLFDEVGVENVWKTPAAAALKYLDARENLFANASDEIHGEVMQQLQDGLEQGDTKKELMARIGAAFEGIKQTRADTIANTETSAAFNFARDKAMREAGVTHKKWLHSQRPEQEPRPTHVENDGQIVPLDEPFGIGGVKFMYPSDDSLGAGPEDIINCHCVAIPVEAP